jgi:hypothetical protein
MPRSVTLPVPRDGGYATCYAGFMPARPLITFLCLAACATPPSIPGRLTETPDAAYPALVPLQPIIAAAGVAPEPDPDAELPARTAALNARAAALRGPMDSVQPSPALQ